MNLPPLFDDPELEALACARMPAPEGFTSAMQERIARPKPVAGPAAWWKQAAAILVAASAAAPVLSRQLPSPEQLAGWPSDLAAEAGAALETVLDAAGRISLADLASADQAALQATSGLVPAWPAGTSLGWTALAVALFWIAVHGGVCMSRVSRDRA